METLLKSLRPNITDLINPSVRKVLEFLVENRGFDYSKEEIAGGSGISRPTLYRIWPMLERNGLLQATRKYGKTQLYKINESSELVKLLIKLEIAAVKEQFKRMER
ncbi:MAG: winged helix-turn-helix transcriptional regulator [Candidatus Aenigmarchaeota archaeon]|nr:winged helix-turn-helix transcriptional regulator [Candidatus Aenigmarchaeota archaeon]